MTLIAPRIVLEVNGRRYVMATADDVERLRALKLHDLLTLTYGRWFIDEGPVGTPPIRAVVEDRRSPVYSALAPRPSESQRKDVTSDDP
jgi:hypothetical protein